MEYLNAFLCGGLLCAVGQIILDKTSLTPARILTGYVVAGVMLQAVGVYQYIVDWGGAGATVPLTGFGYSLAKGVAKAVAEEGLLGVLAGDPRPRYQEDPQRVYGMGFAGQNVRFTVDGETLTVHSIDPLEK